MEWRLFATMAEAADTERVTVEPGPDATVADALDALLDEHPAIADRVYDADGDIYGHVNLLIDGTNPFAEGDGLDERVDEDAELALMPAVSGG
jgi:molybdopterin synthase sulfur carrier subunit